MRNAECGPGGEGTADHGSFSSDSASVPPRPSRVVSPETVSSYPTAAGRQTPRYIVTDRVPPPSPPTEVTSKPFPTDPKEQRGNVLLSTNVGPKSYTVQLLPSDGSMVAKETLADTFAKNFDGTNIAGPKHMRDQPGDYCNTALVPHGLVAVEYSIQSGATQKVVGYGLTESGQQIGRPAAAVALDYEDRTGASIYPQLGAINTHIPDGVRAPIQRANLLEALASHTGPVGYGDVRIATGMGKRSLSDTIEVLEKQGLVTYDSESGRIGKKNIQYELGDVPLDDAEAMHTDSAFSTQFLATIRTLHAAGDPIEQEIIFKALPDAVRTQSDEALVRDRVRRHVGSYVRQGVLSYASHTPDRVTDLSITDAGKALVDGYIHEVDKLVAGDAKAHARAADSMAKIQRDPVRYAQRAGELYYPHSRRFQMQQREEKLSGLAGVIGSHADGIVVSNLVDKTDMNPGTMKNYIDVLQKRGVIDIAIVRGARVVRLRNTPPEKK